MGWPRPHNLIPNPQPSRRRSEEAEWRRSAGSLRWGDGLHATCSLPEPEPLRTGPLRSLTTPRLAGLDTSGGVPTNTPNPNPLKQRCHCDPDQPQPGCLPPACMARCNPSGMRSSTRQAGLGVFCRFHRAPLHQRPSNPLAPSLCQQRLFSRIPAFLQSPHTLHSLAASWRLYSAQHFSCHPLSPRDTQPLRCNTQQKRARRAHTRPPGELGKPRTAPLYHGIVAQEVHEVHGLPTLESGEPHGALVLVPGVQEQHVALRRSFRRHPRRPPRNATEAAPRPLRAAPRLHVRVDIVGVQQRELQPRRRAQPQPQAQAERGRAVRHTAGSAPHRSAPPGEGGARAAPRGSAGMDARVAEAESGGEIRWRREDELRRSQEALVNV